MGLFTKLKDSFDASLGKPKDERLDKAKCFSGSAGSYISIAENGFIGIKSLRLKTAKIFHINDLSGFELKTNGKQTANLGGAIAGGILFGAVGAVLGGISSAEKISSICFVFKFNDFESPVIEIEMLPSPVKKGSLLHKSTMEEMGKIMGLLEFIERKYKTETQK